MIKKVIGILLGITLLVTVGACAKKAPTWQEQYDLGIRYLNEGNYEEAIIAFEAAITIDPQQAEGYVYLAEAYIYTNDFENAIRVVNQGIETCGESDAFTRLLNQISISKLLQSGVTENMLQHEELTFFGHSINTLSFQESMEILQQQEYEHYDDISENEGNTFYSVYMKDNTMIHIKKSSYGLEWIQSILNDTYLYPTGIRGIRMSDTMENVLTNLGFSNGREISACIMDIVKSGGINVLVTDNPPYQGYILFHKDLPNECTFVLDDIDSNRIKIKIEFLDSDHNICFNLSLSFGDYDSDSFIDRLTAVSLYRPNEPSSTLRG